MDANALQLMIFPILAGLCLGAALGTIGLAVIRSIDAIAGLGHGPLSAAPRRSPHGR